MAVIKGYKIAVLADISIYWSFNPFHANSLFLYPLKMTENQRFSDVSRVYRKRPVAWNGLIKTLEQVRKILGTTKWGKVFKTGPSKICGRQPLRNLKWYGLLRQTISLQNFSRLSSTNFTWSIFEYLSQIMFVIRWLLSKYINTSKLLDLNKKAYVNKKSIYHLIRTYVTAVEVEI